MQVERAWGFAAGHICRLLVATGVVAAMGAMTGCENASAPASDSTSPNTNTSMEPEAVTAGISQLPPGWSSFSPGGDTTCSDGSEYRFFVRPGDPDKLMVFFQGGGACWTRETCDPAGRPTYTVNIPADYTPFPFGAFNFHNPDNPFRNYSVVMAPYCTGDVHLGAADTAYPGENEDQAPLIVRHQGRANAQAVLDWTYANVPNPEHVFVTGSSAGAIPSPFYASLIADQYPAARIAHLGDGAGGYRRINTDTRPDASWGTFDFINQERGFADLTPDGFNYEQLYIAAAKAHPEIIFAEYDAAEDAVQKRFLAIGGATDVALIDSLKANHADIRAAAPNFRAFITGGASHTILRRPEFYSYGVDGTSVRDWVANLAAYQDVDNVSCTDCTHDTFAGPALPAVMQTLWNNWEDPKQQYVEPFQIFDNVYFVGINWVAAYVLKTSEGLILIDSLYGKWTQQLVRNMTQLGLNPKDVKYVITTHGHFDHAGGNAFFKAFSNARIVMTAEDWALAEEKPEFAALYMPVMPRDIVAADGDVIELGDTRLEMYKTPGHTEGVLSLRYEVHDGDNTYTAMTLGGVGLNFSGVARTQSYIESYRRLQNMQDGISVSLPNHAAMANVFERGAALAERQAGEPHPFVDPDAYRARLATFLANAGAKLEAEQTGTAKDPLQELNSVLSSN